MTEWTDDQHFTSREGLVHEEVEDEVVVLDLRNNVYFGLNPVGHLVWEHIEGGASLGETVEAIAEAFEIDRERADRDVRAFLDDAIDDDLLRPIDDAAD